MYFKLKNINKNCKMYPPIIKRIALSGFEKVSIKFTCGGARVLPIITSNEIGIQKYTAL
jgi:hypothetical protein